MLPGGPARSEWVPLLPVRVIPDPGNMDVFSKEIRQSSLYGMECFDAFAGEISLRPDEPYGTWFRRKERVFSPCVSVSDYPLQDNYGSHRLYIIPDDRRRGAFQRCISYLPPAAD